MDPKDIQIYIKGVREQDRRLLSKTITLIESSRSDHQELARKILDQLLPHTGKAVRLGITGVPGVGKSMFIESLGMALVDTGHRVAVLAVDPSSSRSGGSVMADKTRMERLAVEENAFIRPSPSGGTLGGVARKTRETMLVCEAADFDVIIVETVGVGQSETTVASMVDFFLVLMLSGAGDELQGIKRGVLELADAIAITKADSDNIEKAKNAAKIYETTMHMLQPTSPNWDPPVLTCSALDMIGIVEIWQMVIKYHKKFTASGELEQKRQKQALDWLWSLVEEGLRERFDTNPEIRKRLRRIARAVEKGETSPTRAADKLLFFLDNNRSV
jgi:LAO/AO transport system kinase